MRSGAPLALLVVLFVAAAGCRNPLGRQYEYEEQLYLGVDGAATVIVSGSVPALVALHGVALDPSPGARLDRADVRRVYEEAGCRVASVGQPWRRSGRHFVQVRIATDDIRTLESCGMLRSVYGFERAADERIRYTQTPGAPAGGDPGRVNWKGDEVVGFKVHVPSRIEYHNVKRLDTGENGTPDRGNILTWEQRLADRRAGRPLVMEFTMGTQSILAQTLVVFASAFVAALAVLIAAIWFTVRRGRKRQRAM